MPELIRLEGVTKTYGEHAVTALRTVDLSIERGSFTCIMGQSGCGKSTLLNIVAGLDLPSGGKVTIDGKATSDLDDEALTRLRGEKIGFIFQFFNLLATLTAAENVALPLEIKGVGQTERKVKVARMLERVSMSKRADFFPAQLSGGEMQRIAIARALVHEPVLLIADEPTGNLDSETGAVILELLKELNGEGQTIVMATHSEEAAALGSRLIRMRDGAIVEDSRGEA